VSFTWHCHVHTRIHTHTHPHTLDFNGLPVAYILLRRWLLMSVECVTRPWPSPQRDLFECDWSKWDMIRCTITRQTTGRQAQLYNVVVACSYCALDRFFALSLLATTHCQFGLTKATWFSPAVYTARSAISQHNVIYYSGSTINDDAFDISKAFDKESRPSRFVLN